MTKLELIDELLKHRYAHRGLHNKPVIAENSMTAFIKATEEGFGSELDIHITADGKLAVIHDPSLKRTCGVDLRIEHITMEEAKKYPLEDSDDRIPTLEEVLEMVGGRVPLIVELKTGKYADGTKTCDDLCRATVEVLDKYAAQYNGLFCVESFDPAAVKWFKLNKPEYVRGQLASDLNRERKAHPWLTNFLVKYLLVNKISKPDFLAYGYIDRRHIGNKWKGPRFYWTLKDYHDMKAEEEKGYACIFEGFNPKDYE